MQQIIIPETRKSPTLLRKTLQEVEGHATTRGTFRESKKPKRYSSYAAYMTKLIEAEPSTYEQAVKHREWRNAMQEEDQPIMKNDVWEIIPRPSDKSIVASKWVYKIKRTVDGSIDKYKARFVARGFSQKQRIDYEETFAPTARSLVSLVATMGWNIHQIHVKNLF